MAAPNVVNVATISAKTAQISVNESSDALLLANAASSGKVFKINTIFVSNTHDTETAKVDIKFLDKDAITDAGVVSYSLIKNLEIFKGLSVVVLDKGSAMYMEEDRSIYVKAVQGTADAFISYEEIS